MATDQGVELYSRAPGARRRYRRNKREQREATTGKPEMVREGADGRLKVVDTSPTLREYPEELDKTFYQYLLSYGGEWFWDDLRTPGGIK